MSKTEKKIGKNVSRREFLNTLGVATAGLVFTPLIKSRNVLAYSQGVTDPYLTQVAITQTDNYNQVSIKERVQHLFDSLGGISDTVGSGDKVAIKINLTGGSGSAFSQKLQGTSITESMWTHPEVVRAVGELIIDCGVKPEDIYLVEALWDDASYNNFGYLTVQNDLGIQMIDLNKPDPYDSFMDKEVGENS
ncbi:MAG: DUF362 domain-containing protein, partial [bacterium]